MFTYLLQSVANCMECKIPINYVLYVSVTVNIHMASCQFTRRLISQESLALSFNLMNQGNSPNFYKYNLTDEKLNWEKPSQGNKQYLCYCSLYLRYTSGDVVAYSHAVLQYTYYSIRIFPYWSLEAIGATSV